MKTTLNIDDNLMRQLKEEAVRRNTTMTKIVEDGIRYMVSNGDSEQENPQELPPLPTWKGGRELIDIANREELYRIFDEEKPPWL